MECRFDSCSGHGDRQFVKQAAFSGLFCFLSSKGLKDKMTILYRNLLYLSPMFLIACLLFISGSCMVRDYNCQRALKGTFVEHSETGDLSIKIVRNDTAQIEKNLSTGEIYLKKVKWLGPCSFLLLPDRDFLHLHPPAPADSFIAYTPIKVEIVEVRRDYYVYSATIDSTEKSVAIRRTVFIQK